MSIQTIQTCNGCGDTRTLSNIQDVELAGWRGLGEGRHLCTICINNALKKNQEPE